MTRNEFEKIISRYLESKFTNAEKIGTGRHSTVYRAESHAVKIKHVFFSDDGNNAERIKYAENEINIMRTLSGCPNIAEYTNTSLESLYEDGKKTGCFFVIEMNFADCLSDMIKSGNFILSEKNIIRIAIDICTALCEMHNKNIVHRDVKPDNFFCDFSGNFFLGDFSISGYADKQQSIAGSMRYIAPEIIRKDENINYFKADIYSLGISLYELSDNLYIPFERECINAEKAVTMRMCGEKISPPLNATAELAEIILKACMYNPDMRYGDVTEMLYELRKINSEYHVTPDDFIKR